MAISVSLFPDYQDQNIRSHSPRLPSEDGGLSGSASSRIQYRPQNLSGSTPQSRSSSEFISSSQVDANVDVDIDPDLDFLELFGDDTANDLSMEAAPHEPSSSNEVLEQPFDDDLFCLMGWNNFTNRILKLDQKLMISSVN